MTLRISTSMPNLRPMETGIPNCFVYISKCVPEHPPRIKVSHHAMLSRDDYRQFVSLHIETFELLAGDINQFTAEQVVAICSWVTKNRQVLLDFWYKPEMTCKQARVKLKPVDKSRGEIIPIWGRRNKSQVA